MKETQIIINENNKNNYALWAIIRRGKVSQDSGIKWEGVGGHEKKIIKSVQREGETHRERK